MNKQQFESTAQAFAKKEYGILLTGKGPFPITYETSGEGFKYLAAEYNVVGMDTTPFILDIKNIRVTVIPTKSRYSSIKWTKGIPTQAQKDDILSANEVFETETKEDSQENVKEG